MVGATGSNQTAKARSTATAFSFNASTNTLSATTFVGALTGNASSATTVNGTSGQLLTKDDRIIEPNSITAGRLQFGFTSWNNNNGTPYADYLHLRSYTDASGGNDNLVMFNKDAIGMRIWQQSFGSATAYASFVDVWHSGNDGAGSGLDADLLDGLGQTTANTASTIVARGGGGNFDAGAINVTGGVSNTDNGIRVHSPGGASYATSTSTVTGAIKIRIPAAALGSNTMMSFRVSVYQYNTGLSQQFLISGYNYNVSDTWYYVSAICLTDSGSEFTVRFGSDGTSQCVYIGELASSWSYPQVFVTDFCGGYSGFSQANWATGWNISFETTAFANVTATRSAVRSWNANNDGAGSGLDADLLDGLNSATANTASTIVARDASGNFSAGTISSSLLASVDQGIVNQNNGNAATWYGRILSKNSTSDKSSFLGTYGSIAGVFAHNNALSAWADLYVNTASGSDGGNVYIAGGGSVAIGGVSASYKLDVTGSIRATTQLLSTGNLAAWNTTTPGTGVGGLHLGAASGTSNVGPAITFGARDASSGTNAQAGIYINSDGTYGTRMYFATTDSYAAGSKVAMSIDHLGAVTLSRSGLTAAGQFQSTQANNTATGGGQIYLNGATGNRIDFNGNGVAAPAFTTRSAGTKIVLYPQLDASNVDYAFGIDNGTLWSSVPTTSQQFKWYAGTTNIATLSGTGVLSIFTNGSTLYGPNSTWGASLRVGGNGNADTTNASVVTTNGNLHIDAASGGSGTYLNFYKGNNGVAFGNGGGAGAVAWMGPDGDLWKGSADNTGSVYWHAGNDGAGSGLDADLLDGITATGLFNNMGNAHGTRSAFDATTPSYDFGFRFVQGSGNGPATGGTQYYSWYIGLGSDYPATGAGSYGAMFAVDRNVAAPYLSVRYNENNGFGSWRKISAGFADTSGSSASCSGNAATATTASYVSSPDGDRNAGTKLPTTSPLAVRFDFASASTTGTGGNYAGVMTYAPWTGTTASTGDASYQLVFGSTATNGSGIPKLNIRNGIDSTWNSWYTLWHSGNDGTGSGLDADLLDGISSGSFLRSDTTTTWSGSAAGIFTIGLPAGALGSTVGAVNTLQIYQPTVNTDAFLTFHVAGDYAAHFGLDGTTNDLFYGGWSVGAVKNKVWHQGNDGSGSGLDADLLDGLNSATANTVSTIVARDGSGNFSAGTITASLTGNSSTTSGCTFANDAVNKADITTRTDSGFYEHDTASTADGWPIDSNTWIHMIACTHSNDANYYSMQIAASFFNQTDLYYRSVNNNGATAWNKMWHSGNDGAGSGLDADLLDGENLVDNAATANTVVGRDASANVIANDFNSTSDIKLKTNIKTLTNSLDKVLQMRGVEFDRIDIEGKHQIGFIAQEIEKIVPELVSENQGTKSVAYGNITALLIEAIKELKGEIEELKSKIPV
jgi:hypothetical protein